jgi:hybrid cluster-associated redox disulfide protein
MILPSISPKTSIADLLSRWPQVVPVFLKHKMSCPGCSMSAFETLEDASKIYNVDLNQLIDELSLTASVTNAAEAEEENKHSIQESTEEQTVTTPYTFFEDINATIDSIPTESIVSRTVFRDDHLKSIVFAFAPGQELSEHTASVPAIIQILEGECELTLGSDSYSVKAGAWARMPANLPHSILAKTPVKMLLLMLT